ncbi:alpha-mannosidase [Bacillus sp. J14TS2]|uniref:alpha-mannosidase n=1 Tax=Bacillus sp. J14TS2 TaxID=2807188 RepID=UPI001B0542E5|nr:alpha-mannosidase [Bacillus sp. J14TS2]GIN71502.1 alpha-mannosidase [Bacillus sp. J14TS2]
MFWTVEKLEKQINELPSYRYIDKRPLETFDSLFEEESVVGQHPPENGKWEKMSIGQRWKGRDQYVWLKAVLTIPSEWKDKTIVGVFDFGKTGDAHLSGFESLLYVNGRPYQGVDSNHEEVFFDDQLVGTKVELCFRLWSGLEGGGTPKEQEHELKMAFLSCLDKKVDDFYYTAKVAVDTAKYLDENLPERVNLLNALDRAFFRVNWARPGNATFYKTIYEAQKLLNEEIDKIPKNYPVTINAVGHTHIDVAWLWRLNHTREKSVRSFSTVLRLMEQYPDYIFLQTQPQLYDYIKKDYPEIFEQIKKRVEEGYWETDGGMWLEADCNLPSGESLVRQLLLGTKFIREQFGKECEYLWLPDVFGYSWALPQILIKSGIKTFMTTKISWNQFNQMPHDTFKWRGIDGTEILTHFITTPDDDTGYYTYNGILTPRTVKGSWEAYRDKNINQELIIAYGYGDGGGGVNREMLEMRRRLDKMPGLPKVKTGRADEYFQRLHETIEKTDQYVHTWDGELYLEYHRGTYTSQAHNKRMNRKLELLLRETEWLSAFRAVIDGDWSSYPSEELTDSWKIVLRNQFHDIIPGSSIKEVYEDSKIEYEQAKKLADEAWTRAATSLVYAVENKITVFNSASNKRDDIVVIDQTQANLIWKDLQGNLLDSQRSIDGRWLVRVKNIPSLGNTSIEFEEGTLEKTSAFTLKENGVISPFYEIDWDENGQLTRILDLQNNRDVLAPNSKGNAFQVFEDKPMKFDAWDIDLYYYQKMREIRMLKNVNVIENGLVRSVIEFTWEYCESTIKQNLILYAKNPRIDFETLVNWQEQQQLLKVAFPVDVRSTEATYDIQYGNVKRPTHWNTSWDYARFETVGHQWVDLSETGYGVSLLNNCKYGHDIKDNVMRLTLIKSATWPDVEQDQGEHYFTYSLLPHAGDWIEGNTVQAAWNLNNPLTCKKGMMQTSSLFQIEGSNVMIDAVKKSEVSNQVILRLHEFTGARGTVKITSDSNIISWQESDLMERAIDGQVKGKPFAFSIKPYEIKTFIIDIEQ